MRFQTEKVVEGIKMLENAKIGFVEMDEDRNMKDGVRAQIAKTNGVILNQSVEERMDQNAKSMIEIIFKHDQFIAVGGRGVGKLLPRAGHHPTVTLSGSTPSTTNWFSTASLLTELTHSSTRLSSRDALLEPLWLLLGAISPI